MFSLKLVYYKLLCFHTYLFLFTKAKTSEYGYKKNEGPSNSSKEIFLFLNN